jgi:hypothetical protein
LGCLIFIGLVTTIKDLNQPLGDEEIEWLESFLLDRFDEEADYLDVDEGVFSISELDGLLTAVVSGPVLVPPSQWLPAVWGDVEPQWQSEQQLQQVMSLSPAYHRDLEVWRSWSTNLQGVLANPSWRRRVGEFALRNETAEVARF